jgi:hypothetical protein
MKETLLILFMLIIESVACAGGTNSSGNTNSSGRFQVVQLSQMRKDQILIDTQTGKMWKYTCFKTSADGCSVEAWAPEMIIDINTSYEKVFKLSE